MQPADLSTPSDEKLASAQESAVATSPEEEERGPFLISPSQVRNAKVIWPDVDLIDQPGTSFTSRPVEALKATGRALARGWFWARHTFWGRQSSNTLTQPQEGAHRAELQEGAHRKEL